MYLCIGATYSTVSALMTGPLIGLRRFRALTMFEATKIVGTVGGGVVGAAFIARGAEGPFGTASDATIVGACVGIAMGAVTVAQLAWIMRRVQASAASRMRSFSRSLKRRRTGRDALSGAVDESFGMMGNTPGRPDCRERWVVSHHH